MYSDVMLDLEYLASADNAVITQIAMIPFDIETSYYKGMEDERPTESFNCSPSISDQLQIGRTIDEDTMVWWMNQCAANRATPLWMNDEEGLLENVLTVYIPTWSAGLFDWKDVRVWSHVRCDIGKLRHAYGQLEVNDMHVPWHRNNEWHLQTVTRLARRKVEATHTAQEGYSTQAAARASLQLEKLEKYRDERNHDALQDCIAQIKEVTLAWEILNA